MNRNRAEVGDQVKDTTGQGAIVTDIKGGTTWVLRPVYAGNFTTRWETDDPDTLTVTRRRADRITDP